MKKILIFYDTPINLNGGISGHCIALKELLEKSGEYQVTLINNLKYKKISSLKLYSRKEIKSILLNTDYDIIHIHGFITILPYQIMRCVKQLHLKKKIIYTPHAHPFYTLNHPKLNRCFFELFVKPVLKFVTFIVSSNKKDYSFLLKYNKNIKTITHWATYNFSEKTTSVNKRPMLLFVGRNDSNKNLSILYLLPKDKYNIVCVTNKRPDREDFDFKFNIPTEELAELYKKADLTVVPSRFESFSYAALESLSKGTPVLMSDRVRIADFLENVSGVTIYDYNNPAEFVDKIDSAIKTKVDVVKVEGIFSSQTALDAYNDLYNR